MQHLTELLKWHLPFEIMIRNNITFFLVRTPVWTQQLRGLGSLVGLAIKIIESHVEYYLNDLINKNVRNLEMLSK